MYKRIFCLVLLVLFHVQAYATSTILITNTASGDVYSGLIESGDFAVGDDVFVTFMKGFSLIFAAGVVAIGVNWVRVIIGGGHEEGE